ncbi:kinase-like protein [Xylaria arbuscula]|nr:kinase-like protein [Xylaria arbuscula]
MALYESHLVTASRLETEFVSGCTKHKLRNPISSQLLVEEEFWEFQSTIGKGTFGIVRIERRRASQLHPNPSHPKQLRAVKEISKSVALSQRWDYMKELEAIARFSSSQYAPYFVRSHGWFENDESIFISMEYFSLGDLRHFMEKLLFNTAFIDLWFFDSKQPKFSEDASQQIVRQLLRGIRFMHASNFAHRDLKPANILVASYSPRWVVKIADFGISKQFADGGSSLQTQVGTLGYMAPEICDSNSYSVSVDIWAIGIITIELLLRQHPLPTPYDLVDYVRGRKLLVTDTEEGLFLSEECRDFARGLLNADPVARPTANSALSHPWLEEVIPDSDDEESLFVTDDALAQNPSQRERHGATPISLPSLAWSNLQLTNNTLMSQSTGLLLNTYHGPALDSRLLLPSLQCFVLETNKYFVLRSDNPIDIEISAAHNVWTSSPRVNKILDKAWRKTDGQVILFFSVIGSQRFCGVAQMTSGMDWANTDEHWLEDNWQGRFTLNWLSMTELPFAGVKHVPVKSTTPGFRAISCYDGTEISAPSAFELLQAYTAREREEASQLISPPATATPMDVNTMRSPAPSSFSMEDQYLTSSIGPHVGEQETRGGQQRTSSSVGSLEFSSILRPLR